MFKKIFIVFLVFFSLTIAVALALNIATFDDGHRVTSCLTDTNSPTTNPPTTGLPVTDFPITTSVALKTTEVITTTVETTSKEISTVQPITTQIKPVTTSAAVTMTPKTTTITHPVTTTKRPSETSKTYADHIDPTGDDWSDLYLLLVNADNPISKDFEKSVKPLSNIVSSDTVGEYKYSRYMNFQLNECALQALTAMILEAQKDGVCDLYPVSAYRDYAYQDRLFSNNVKLTNKYECENCGYVWIGKSSECSQCHEKSTKKLDITIEEKEKNVATYSCRPGTSDHQTGLVVDLIQSSLPNKYHHLIQEFGETKAGKWLEENCTRFGFILRFPKDKEEITGIIYEPWHFRFVGKTHAEKMKELGMCLEEYTEYLANEMSDQWASNG